MTSSASMAANLRFWHWYPKLLTEDLTPEQLRWQPEDHDTSILFAVWHTYRAADELGHGLAMGGRPSVYASGGWDTRLTVAETGRSPFGNGLNREQIGNLSLDVGELCSYATAVGDSLIAYLESTPPETLAEEVDIAFFRGIYEGGVDRMSRLETILFFAVGHTAEHLGEVQMVRGLMGLKGAPL